MSLQEIISFLTNEEKRKNLILKLQHEGEDSKQIHAFRDIIVSLNLHKPPPGIQQKTILQNTFRYSDPRECFDNFRLVCKPWQDAVETIRFNKCLHIPTICKHVHNGNFSEFYVKYFRAFKKVAITFTPYMLQNWNTLSPIILNNMKKLNFIGFHTEQHLPENFNNFVYQLLQNSQLTLKILRFSGTIIFELPLICLPNVERIGFHVSKHHGHQIEKFDRFMKNSLANCEDMSQFWVYNIDDCVQIRKYIGENYPEHCTDTNSNITSHYLPMKASFCSPLSDMVHFKYPSKIEILYIRIKNLNLPFTDGWEKYQEMFALIPNLKHVVMTTKSGIEIEEALNDISQENQRIWKQRISFLTSCGIHFVNFKEFNAKVEKSFHTNKWGFRFICK